MELICLPLASHWRGEQHVECCRSPGCAAAVALLSHSPCWPCCCTKHLWPPARARCQRNWESNSCRLMALGATVCVPRLVLGQVIEEDKLWALGQHKQTIQQSLTKHRWEWGGGRRAVHVPQSSSPSPLATLSEAPAFHLGRRFLQGL